MLKAVSISAAAKDLISGMIIGAVMLIPGVSGGSAAIILGIYDRLIAAVDLTHKPVKKNIMFLSTVTCGGIIGAFLFSDAALWLTENVYKQTCFFFMGAILGSIPIMIKKSELNLKSACHTLYAGVGILICLAVTSLPSAQGATDIQSTGGALCLFFCGILISAALILPGISTSHILLVTGLYQPVLKAVSERQLFFLLILGTGIILGIIFLTGLLDRMLKRFPSRCYMLITGFVIASVFDIYPSDRSLPDPVCCILFIFAFTAVFMLSRNECKDKKISSVREYHT